VAALAYISTVDVMVANGPEGTEYYAGSLPVADDATDGGWASNTPQVLAITKTCAHPEQAAAFLNYFFTNETAMETLGATRSVPPTARAREICAANGSLTKLVTDAADIAVAISGTPNDKIFSTAECKNILYDAVEAIAYGDMTPAEAAADTIAQLKELEKSGIPCKRNTTPSPRTATSSMPSSTS
jgi:oligogalacturonide transport system substrate-binding protein